MNRKFKTPTKQQLIEKGYLKPISKELWQSFYCEQIPNTDDWLLTDKGRDLLRFDQRQAYADYVYERRTDSQSAGQSVNTWIDMLISEEISDMQLTDRQVEIVRLLLSNHLQTEIASILGLSLITVKRDIRLMRDMVCK